MTNLNDLDLNRYRVWPDMLDLVRAMKNNAMVWNWGAENFTSYLGKLLQFKVYGRRFEGWVCIGVNALDVFNVFLVDQDQNIVHALEDVHLEDLVPMLDEVIQSQDPVFSVTTKPC